MIKMANSYNTSNSSVCSVYDSYDYVIVAAVSAGTAMVSALCCIFVIAIIFLLKKHYFFIQRIILYHCLAALFRAFSTMLRFHRLGYRSKSAAINALCVFSGFTDQVTNWHLIMDYSVIIFILLMTGVFRKNVARLEGLFIVLIFIFPLTFNWIPFINSSYGRAGAWCSIKNLNFDDCTEYKFGKILRTILQTVPHYLFLAVAIPTLLFIIVYLLQQKYCRENRSLSDQDTRNFNKHLNEAVLPLLFFPFGVLFLNIVPLINRIYISVNVDSPSYALWITGAIFSPLQGGYIAVVYTLDRDTLRRLNYSNLVVTLCRRRENIHDYPTISQRSDSVLSSEEHEIHYNKFVDSDEQF